MELKAPVVLINGHAGSVRRDPGLPERLRRRLPADHVRTTQSVDEIADALEALRATGAQTLFVVGGDGSVTGTLTELMRVWPESELPELVLTAGGTINTIATSLGARGRPDEMLTRFLAAPGGADALVRPLLRIAAEDAPARYGMIFANGAAARFLAEYYDGPSGARPAAALVARTLLAMPLGGDLARRMFEPYEALVEIDGEPSEGRFSVAGAASVRHVGLGFAPFRTAGHWPDRFHWLSTAATPGALGREIPLFALGIYAPRSCLAHASPRSVRLSTAGPEPYTIDGDLFEACRRVEIDAGPQIRFRTP